MKHYTAATKYELVCIESPDGTGKEILRAIDPVEIPGDFDAELAEHVIEGRNANSIYLDPPFFLHRNGEVGKKVSAPFVKPFKER